jgi:ABC-type uncharacterized transport system substrate-binding protein
MNRAAGGTLAGLLVMAGIVATPERVAGQMPAGPREVAFLCSRFCFDSAEDLRTTRVGQSLLSGLRTGGYVEGTGVRLELASSNVGPDLTRHAAELGRRQPAVILAFGDDAVRAARSATATVPIVMVAVNDAVEQGLVASLARPGGNITGVSVPTLQVWEKRLELLVEMVPRLTRVAVLENPANPRHESLARHVDAVGRRIGIVVQRITARDEADFGDAVAAIGAPRPVALLVFGDPAFYGSRSRGQLAQRALAAKVALLGPTKEYVDSLALMTYEASRTEMFERAGALVAKVLGGRRPSDIPVEEPTRYDLFVSASAARVLGLTIPPSVLTRAEVLP